MFAIEGQHYETTPAASILVQHKVAGKIHNRDTCTGKLLGDLKICKSLSPHSSPKQDHLTQR